MSQFVDNAYSAAVRLCERVFPGPDHLGAPLPAELAGGPQQPKPPVLLVHGMGCSPRTFDEWARSLRTDGFTVKVSELPNHAMGDIRTSARIVRQDISDFRAQTGADRVAVIGFSEGGLIARDAVEHLGGAPEVSTLVNVATPNHGSKLATHEAFFEDHPRIAKLLPVAMREMAPDGPTIASFEQTDVPSLEADTGVHYVSIRNPAFDGFVAPATSPEIDGADNIVLPVAHSVLGRAVGPNHYSVIHQNAPAYEAARGAILARP